METTSRRLRIITIILLLIIIVSVSVSCLGTTSQLPSFYDAGASNFTATGSQFAQYFIYHFDTATSGRSFTLPNAADIVSAVQSPIVGEAFVMGVTADGSNPVTLIGGTNVTIKPSAMTVAPNTTLTIYCIFDNVSSENQAVTLY